MAKKTDIKRRLRGDNRLKKSPKIVIRSFDEGIKNREFSLSLNGHFYGIVNKDLCEDLSRQLETSFVLRDYNLYLKDIATKTGVKLDYIDEDGESFTIKPSILCKCPCCCEPVGFKVTKDSISITTPCPHPKGYPAFEFDLSVPSGKMVVGNDFRNEFKVIGSYSCNSAKGMEQITQQYAKIGLAHCFVGNTCPGVFKVGKQDFRIGRGRGSIASICTDLWWFSICDYDEFVRRGGDPSKENVIECKPGTYHFKHVYHCGRKEPTKDYTYITWVSKETKPIVDDFAERNFTVEQVIHKAITEGYFNDIIAIANHLMCVIGNGSEYHPNGWHGYTEMPKDEPEVEIPIFDKPYAWYPLCSYSNIMTAVENEPLNPSFARLAFNIVQCMLRHGVLDFATKQVKPAGKDVEKLFEKLKEKYPVPDFCRDL